MSVLEVPLLGQRDAPLCSMCAIHGELHTSNLQLPASELYSAVPASIAQDHDMICSTINQDNRLVFGSRPGDDLAQCS